MDHVGMHEHVKSTSVQSIPENQSCMGWDTLGPGLISVLELRGLYITIQQLKFSITIKTH